MSRIAALLDAALAGLSLGEARRELMAAMMRAFHPLPAAPDPVLPRPRRRKAAK